MRLNRTVGITYVNLLKPTYYGVANASKIRIRIITQRVGCKPNFYFIGKVIVNNKIIWTTEECINPLWVKHAVFTVLDLLFGTGTKEIGHWHYQLANPYTYYP